MKSKEEIVLTEIKGANDIDSPIWFTKIVENLDGVLSRSEVGIAIDRLSDLGYIKGRYGEVRKGWSGYKYHITDIGESLFKMR
ncbi:hypothetical protein GQ473_00360 [archaeon]|nr:hypothetical protein [archaeon]